MEQQREFCLMREVRNLVDGLLVGEWNRSRAAAVGFPLRAWYGTLNAGFAPLHHPDRMEGAR